jgi:murein DD-endopeptidase MepM/ murein hydrolase activator NlpD
MLPLAALALLLPVCAPAASGAAASARDWARFSVLTPAGPEEPDASVLRTVKRLLWAVHKVGKDETSAGRLAKLYGTTVMSLQTTNNDELYYSLRAGRRLVVHNRDGMLYEVKKDSETLDHIVARFKRGAQQTRQFKEWVVKANNLPGYALLDDYEFDKGDRVLLPGIQVSFDTYHYPVASVTRFSSRFGMRYHPLLHAKRMHQGVDIPKPYGTPVRPARSGVVVDAGWHEGYGLLVVIRHVDGWTTRYGHLSKILVKPGQTVLRDRTVIGKVGSTGISTGPHLHFEVRDRNGIPINPTTKIGRR